VREAFFKLLPYLLGALLGWLLVSPPEAFAALGAWRPVVLAAIVGAALLAFTGVSLAASLPERPALAPYGGEPTADVARLLDAFRGLGFEPCEPPLVADLKPSATLWVLAHREAGCFASVYRTGTLPPRAGFDCISEIEGGRGALSSVADPAAAVLPLAPGSFKQVLAGASPEALFDFHRRAHAFLAGRGVRFERAAPGGVAEGVARSLARQRAVVVGNPLRAAALTLWRATTRTTPYALPVERQSSTEEQVRRLLAGEIQG
jgi:hypothetical protein